MPLRGHPSGSAPRAALPLLLGMGLVVLAGCRESVTQVGPADIVALRASPDSATVAVGRTFRVDALPLDATGALIVGQDISWTSADPTVATVDESGFVTGVAVGETEVVASIAGLEARVFVTVELPAALELSDDTVRFSAQAGGSDPPAEAVSITNGGVLPLVGLTVDSVVYDLGAEDWLVAQVSGSAAPATLDLTASVSGITVSGTYTATVWLSATDADDSPAAVVAELEVAAGTATAMAVDDGDGQSGAVGEPLATPPSVSVTDAFDNPVPGVQVTFTVTGGGGSVTGSPATTDGTGIARVEAWTLGTVAGQNTLEATLAGVPSVTFTATGEPGPATRLQISAGDGQSAVAGSAVAVSPAVSALDVFDNGVPGVSVSFAVVSGGGSITGAAQTTDADGIATAGTWTLGVMVGQNTLRATAAAIPDSVDFTATGLSGEAVAIRLEAGDAQTDTVAATLATEYAVEVVDANDNGVEGIQVSWSVTGGGGSIDMTSTTDAFGIATAVRVLGTTAGPQTAEAAVGGLAGSPVAFTATALVGAPASIGVAAGDGQTATVATQVAVPPQVVVRDQFMNPIAGHSVTFSVTGGGGSVVPTTSILTEADGTATATSWTLGTAAGVNNNTLQALAAGAGIAGNPVTLTATATADVPAAVGVQSGDGQTAVTGTTVANAPTVLVEDQYGNGVPNVAVDFTPSGAGQVGSPSVQTNANGVASTSWTVDVGGAAVQDDGTFPNTLTATVQGTGLATSFDADAIYSYEIHVDPLWAAGGCTGCHGGVSGLTLGNADPADNYAALVDVVPVCAEGGLPAAYRRVSAAGGVDAADEFSILMRFIDPGLARIGLCDTPADMSMSSSAISIIRAWIRNGAPSDN